MVLEINYLEAAITRLLHTHNTESWWLYEQPCKSRKLLYIHDGLALILIVTWNHLQYYLLSYKWPVRWRIDKNNSKKEILLGSTWTYLVAHSQRGSRVPGDECHELSKLSPTIFTLPLSHPVLPTRKSVLFADQKVSLWMVVIFWVIYRPSYTR